MREKGPAASSQTTIRVFAILAVRNRVDKTMQCLASLSRSATHSNIQLDITIFDDGSTDGTRAALALGYPDATVIAGDGSFFWARAMATAERHVLTSKAPEPEDFLLWLNDDVVIDKDLFYRFQDFTRTRSGTVLVGATESSSGVTTYSGMKSRGHNPLSFELVEPSFDLRAVDTFNGNVVFVPTSVAISMGGIDGEFSHAIADIDYGLRLRKNSISVLLMPGYAGTCERNAEIDTDTPVLDRWRTFKSRKGGAEPASMKRALKRHSPCAWPLYWASIYILWWIREVRSVITKMMPSKRSSSYKTWTKK